MQKGNILLIYRQAMQIYMCMYMYAQVIKYWQLDGKLLNVI